MITPESRQELERAHKHLGLKFDLLSDPEYKLLKPLGAKRIGGGVIPSWFLVRHRWLYIAKYNIDAGIHSFDKFLDITYDHVFTDKIERDMRNI